MSDCVYCHYDPCLCWKVGSTQLSPAGEGAQEPTLKQQADLAARVFERTPHPGMNDPEPDYGFAGEDAQETRVRAQEGLRALYLLANVAAPYMERDELTFLVTAIRYAIHPPERAALVEQIERLIGGVGRGRANQYFGSAEVVAWSYVEPLLREAAAALRGETGDK